MTRWYFSTRSSGYDGVSLKDAVMNGQAPDGGLYVPDEIPRLAPDFIRALSQLSDEEIVEALSATWLAGSVDEPAARMLAREAINFPTPLSQLNASNFILELFHGPTLAFKDYGARFMARLLSHFLREKSARQTILVATSGDTGSAVAAGFLGLENIRVVVLYPSGRVSALQEKQMTTLGKNISALEVKGNFDDCQRLVKAAFAEDELRKKCALNSANSINIARLIAQTFYYFLAYARLFRFDEAPVFAVPSGNLGNLTAGIIAKRMGLPVHQFIAATNVNDVFAKYLLTGKMEPRPSQQTISSAMDVGNPSNFERLSSIYNGELLEIKQDVVSYTATDSQTMETMRRVSDEYSYVLDPHGAVGYHGLACWRMQAMDDERPGIVLATAHPGKFAHDVERAIGRELKLPPALLDLSHRVKQSQVMENDFGQLKKWLLKI